METGLWKQFDRIVVFDTETTGIEFGRDEIIELGAAAFSAEGETDCMDLLLRLSPGRTAALYHPAHWHHGRAAGTGGRGEGRRL
jgi:DNA polymerase III epsilon subunit-like protein